MDAGAEPIASRYGVTDENIPQINEEAFKKNREIGKTVVPLKEYFRQSAADFEKKEIENLIKKEIREFMGSNTVKKFEDKLLDNISKDLKRGKLEKDVKDLIIKSFREFYTVMYQQRSFWESKFRGI